MQQVGTRPAMWALLVDRGRGQVPELSLYWRHADATEAAWKHLGDSEGGNVIHITLVPISGDPPD